MISNLNYWLSTCRNALDSIKSQLKREANFGCAVCGCPILEGAHIIPFQESHEFLAEDMITLCPTCHSRAHTGEFSQDSLREFKKNPHNRSTLQDRFFIENTDLVVNIGSTRFVNAHRIFVINDFDILTVDRDENNNLNLNVSFFDATNKFVGSILDNEWVVDATFKWQINYKSRNLVIRNQQRNILLDLRLQSGELVMTGMLYYLGHSVVVKPDGVWLGERDTSTGLRNVTISHVETAFDLQV